MASGTIWGRTSNDYIEAKVEWSSTASVEYNRSTIIATLYYRRLNTGYTTYGTGSFTLRIGSAIQTESKTVELTNSDWVQVLSLTTTVFHGTDGTKSVTISASGSIPGTTLSYTNLEKLVTLDTIHRATTIDSLSCSTNYFTGTLTYKYTPNSTSFYHRLNITLNMDGAHTDVGTFYPKPTSVSQQTATMTLIPGELKTIYEKIPNGTKGTLRFTLHTYSDSKYSKEIGSGQYKEITLSIPDTADTRPIVVKMSVSPSNNLTSPYNSLYIQGHSKVKATLEFSARYGATIVASNITVDGKTYAEPYESDILSQDGTISVKATVKDSRGFYGTYYQEIEVIPYRNPYVTAKSSETSIIAARCDSSANFTDSGTYLKIKAKAVYSKVISRGVQNNYGKIKFRYRIEGGAYTAWETILDCERDHSDEVITPPLLNGALDIKSNYQVQIIASDDLYDSVPITIAIPSDEVYMDRPAGGKSMGLGGYSSGDGNLDIHWKTKARGGVSLYDSKGNEIPLDSTLPLPRDQVETGWNPDNLECGIYAVSSSKPLKQGDTVIMYNGVLIQMTAYVGGNVKIQLALTSDETRNPYYRVYWYGNWGNWRSFKL